MAKIKARTGPTTFILKVSLCLLSLLTAARSTVKAVADPQCRPFGTDGPGVGNIYNWNWVSKPNNPAGVFAGTSARESFRRPPRAAPACYPSCLKDFMRA